jgi:hypothetical protein
MSHLSTLTERFIVSLENKDETFGEDELKFRLADIIEYVYYFHKLIKKEELNELLNDLKQ